MITYEPLRILLVKRNISKGDFYAMTGIQPRTGAKLWRDENVNVDTIDRICAAMDVDVSEIMRFKKED